MIRLIVALVLVCTFLPTTADARRRRLTVEQYYDRSRHIMYHHGRRHYRRHTPYEVDVPSSPTGGSEGVRPFGVMPPIPFQYATGSSLLAAYTVYPYDYDRSRAASCGGVYAQD